MVCWRGQGLKRRVEALAGGPVGRYRFFPSRVFPQQGRGEAAPQSPVARGMEAVRALLAALRREESAAKVCACATCQAGVRAAAASAAAKAPTAGASTGGAAVDEAQPGCSQGEAPGIVRGCGDASDGGPPDAAQPRTSAEEGEAQAGGEAAGAHLGSSEGGDAAGGAHARGGPPTSGPLQGALSGAQPESSHEEPPGKQLRRSGREQLPGRQPGGLAETLPGPLPGTSGEERAVGARDSDGQAAEGAAADGAARQGVAPDAAGCRGPPKNGTGGRSGDAGGLCADAAAQEAGDATAAAGEDGCFSGVWLGTGVPPMECLPGYRAEVST